MAALSPLPHTAFLNPAAPTIGRRAGLPVGRAEFEARMHAWHALLVAHPGRKFALYLDDSIEFAAVLLAAWYAGKTIWLSADTLDSSVAALRVQVDGFIGDFPRACEPMKHLTGCAAPSEFGTLDPDFVGLVVHTSGSTGAPQAIPKKLSQLANEIATLEQLFGARLADAEVVATVTHQHIYGLLFKVLWPLYAGRALHAETLIYPEQLAEQLVCRSCAVISSPAHLKRLPAHLDWTPCQALFCSGGVLPADVALSSAAVLGSMPIEVYGSSESGGIAWRQRVDQRDDAWTALPGVAWRCDSADRLIAIRSPHLFNDQWQQLADRIELVDNGRFRLIGRSDRIVKIEEKRISLDALEQQLLGSPLIAEIRLVQAESDQQHHQRQYLAAVAVLSESGRQYLQQYGKLALNRQLKAVLINAVEPVAVPRRWRYVDQLPLNAQGKTTQALLWALFDDTVSEPQIELRLHDAQHVEFVLRWPRALHYFIGHFPEAPVLPGIVQVHWAIRVARKVFVLADQFHAMHGVKFQHVVLPGDETLLTLDYDLNQRSLRFSYSSPGKQHSSGKVLFHD